MEDEDDLQLTQTLTGRLRNFPLSPSPDNALWGAYEAVSNSIHAIRDRHADSVKGRIDVTVHRDNDGDVNGFAVQDNGIGLNLENYRSFRKIDSTFKARRGGKGVGRLTWLKIFELASLRSVYLLSDGRQEERSFDFVSSDANPIQNYHRGAPSSGGTLGTLVTLTGMKPEYSRECPKRPETIVRALIRHFVKDLIATSDPINIFVHDGSVANLREEFDASVVRRDETPFSVAIGGHDRSFKLPSLVTSKAFADVEANENVTYLLAHGRVVDKRAISGLVGLKKLQGGRTYVGLIEGEYLDEAVSQERTMLTANPMLIDLIVRKASEQAVAFLYEDTRPVRERQLTMVRQIKREYPRFIGTLSEEAAFVENKLPLSVRDQESVFRAVSLEWYRAKRKVDRSVKSALSNPRNDEEFSKALAEATKSIATESRAIVADYLAERKVVIDFLARMVARVRSSPDDNYELEARVHDLIAPRKGDSLTTKLETHNLWLLDERLPYYFYFNSDLPLKKQIEGSDDLRRPDISMYDVASTFQQRGANEPVIVVEIKRPGRDDYSAKDDPVRQCLDYVMEMRAGRKLTSSDGSWVSTVQVNTLFYCYVLADLTPSLRKIVEERDMKPTPDGRGYFYFHERLRAWCEVVLFDKLIESNRVRHNAFFEKLGLT